MSEEATRKLELRLIPAEGTPDAALFDDLVRLLKQGVATAPKQAPQVNTTGEFHPPTDNAQNALEAKIKHRVEQASEASKAAVAKRAETAQQPDGDAQLADEALAAAQDVVAAVQRMLLRGITVRVPEDAK